MTYIVTKAPSLAVVKYGSDFSSGKYDLVAIPIDLFHLQKLIDGSIRIAHCDEIFHTHILAQIQTESFRAEGGKIMHAVCNNGGKTSHLIFFGLEEVFDNLPSAKSLSSKMQDLGSKIASSAASIKAGSIAIIGTFFTLTDINCYYNSAVVAIASGCAQKSYRFSKYITTTRRQSEIHKVKDIVIAVADLGSLCEEINGVTEELNAIYLTKDLVNEPPNILYPDTYADIIKEHIKDTTVKVSILQVSDLKKMGMEMMLGVSSGSDRKPCVIIMNYRGNKEKSAIDLALVGKGVTFDSGGLSIKPSTAMESMKTDMAGSAAVVGTIKLLAARKASVNAVGVIGLTENVINGLAQKPGDIVCSMSGQTVEVLNTDAEGRLVLGDILYYTIKEYQPRHVIDLATLTGAIVVSLGTQRAGLFANSDAIADCISSSGNFTGEEVWRMPLSAEYDKMLDSNIADMKNISGSGTAGSITAAQFLQRFIGDCKSWAHLDIAGVAYHEGRASRSTNGECGATGFGIKLLNAFVKTHIEDNNF